LLYVLAEALVFFGVTEVALVSAVATAFCIALPSQPLDPLLKTIVVGGSLACARDLQAPHDHALRHARSARRRGAAERREGA